jgi:hypothetical protein
MRKGPIKIRHAPWSKWLKTFYVNGSFAHEIQVGPVVAQWFHEPWERAIFFDRLHFWRDKFWRTKKGNTWLKRVRQRRCTTAS